MICLFKSLHPYHLLIQQDKPLPDDPVVMVMPEEPVSEPAPLPDLLQKLCEGIRGGPAPQQLVLDAGKVAHDTAREKLVEVEDDYLEKLGKEMEIYDPTQEELEAFQKVAMTSWDIIEQDMGSEKFNEIVNAAQEIDDSLK